MDIGGNPSAVYDHEHGKLILQVNFRRRRRHHQLLLALTF
jgi:hypothetical protein